MECAGIRILTSKQELLKPRLKCVKTTVYFVFAAPTRTYILAFETNCILYHLCSDLYQETKDKDKTEKNRKLWDIINLKQAAKCLP